MTKRAGLIALAVVAVVAFPAMLALAQGPGYGYGPGMGYGQGMMGGYGPGYGYGHMGPGMMWGYGSGYGPGYGQPGPANPQAQVTDDQAKEIAQKYADKYLKGFTVDKVLPFGTPMGTSYSVELKGPQDEMRVLHVNPWGSVMPFGGPWRRSG
jgi:hypothetical protein